MTFDDRLDDRQPQPASAPALADSARRICLEEPIEHMREVLRCDPGALVSHREHDSIALSVRSQRDG